MSSAARRPRKPGSRLAPRAGRLYRPRPGRLDATPAAAPPPRITVLAWNTARLVDQEVSGLEEALALVLEGGVTWINIDGTEDARVLMRLGERFGLHPLALEDSLNVLQRPKVERYGTHLFVVMRTLRLVDGEIVQEQVSAFVGEGWVLTLQERREGDPFTPVREAIRQGRGRAREAGAGHLLYQLLDAVVDAYFPVIEAYGERMQALETAALDAADQEVLIQMQELRHDLLALRRALWPMREEVGILLREDSTLLGAETQLFLRDVHDHAVQALEIVESLRETEVSLMEVYLSVQNQRLNEVMKVLTVIATLFIPLTFIASIYGMNFKHVPELEWRYGYAWALGLMLATALALVGFFKRRGWW